VEHVLSKSKCVTELGEQARQSGRETQYEWIRVKKILLPKSEDRLDEKTVAGIAESILVFDLLHPIAVRRVTEKQKEGEIRERIVLVAGAHRLEAMKRLKRKKIPCYFVNGDETNTQLVRLGENLWRKTLTVLRNAEGLVEYLNLASAKVNLSGQPVRKSKLGRPPGGISLAARELPLVHRSEAARRKIIDRATKINQISPEAKRAAIEARLDNNQRALLKIAKAGGRSAQLRMVAQLAEISKKLNAPQNCAAKRSTTGDEPSKQKAVRSPPLQPDVTQSATDADDTTGNETGTCLSSQKTTTFDEMVALWKSECRASWAHLPSRDRERFIEMLRLARRRARADVVEFLRDVFRGREKVSKQDLFGIAAIHGFAISTIRKALKGRGYRAKRKGHNWGAKWYIMNPDRDWSGAFPVISDAEIAAAVDAQPDPRDKAVSKGRWKSRSTDYLADI
jgi:hypothetical protein